MPLSYACVQVAFARASTNRIGFKRTAPDHGADAGRVVAPIASAHQFTVVTDALIAVVLETSSVF